MAGRQGTAQVTAISSHLLAPACPVETPNRPMEWTVLPLAEIAVVYDVHRKLKRVCLLVGERGKGRG